MSARGTSYASDDGRFVGVVDDDGYPPCEPPDDCSVCVLFTSQRPDESRSEWLERITGGIPKRTYRRAS